jgi:hypothetical protein
MKETILLNYDENVKLVAQEERNKFLHQLLTKIGIPLDWNLDEPVTPVVKANLRNLLAKYKVIVIEQGEELKVSFQNNIIGRWEKPIYKIKKDSSQLDKKKQLYVELEINFWSHFEENNEK